jgi:hypothetical protein
VTTPSNTSSSPDTSSNGKASVTVFDQEWPDFTIDRTALRPSADGDQTPNVTNVLRDVLGWRPVASDPKAFTAALQASFQLTMVEGHVESTYQRRGFAVQADLGSVSGGQASLYARATASLTHMRTLLAGVTPLRPDFDSEDGAASRTLIGTELTRIVNEMGAAGGPRTALVDAAFQVLVGTDQPVDTITGDVVGGQLGRLRDRFGLTADNVNTVEEERIRTSYWTLVDQVVDLNRAWNSWKKLAGDGAGPGFLGTDLVLISRLLEATSEQIDEYEAVLDSVLIGPAERQTTWLDEDNHLTLDGLLSWLRTFVRVDGPAYLRDSGRDGLATAFVPTARELAAVFQSALVDAVDTGKVPAGMTAARSKRAMSSLGQLLDNVFGAAQSASQPPPVDIGPLDVTISHLSNAKPGADSGTGQANRRLLVEVRTKVTRPGLICAFSGDDNKWVLPLPGTDTVTEGVISGWFAASEKQPPLVLLNGRSRRIFDASVLPMRILDASSGEVLWSSGISDWPDKVDTWKAPADPEKPTWRLDSTRYRTSF